MDETIENGIVILESNTPEVNLTTNFSNLDFEALIPNRTVISVVKTNELMFETNLIEITLGNPHLLDAPKLLIDNRPEVINLDNTTAFEPLKLEILNVAQQGLPGRSFNIIDLTQEQIENLEKVLIKKDIIEITNMIKEVYTELYTSYTFNLNGDPEYVKVFSDSNKTTKLFERLYEYDTNLNIKKIITKDLTNNNHSEVKILRDENFNIIDKEFKLFKSS